MQKTVFHILCFFFGSILLFSCADPEKEDTTTTASGIDRKEVLTHLVDNLVLPGLGQYERQVDTLSGAVDDFIAAPDLNGLSALREAWKNAYISWQKVELFDFGPGENLAIRFYTNIYPCNESEINANIQNPSANLELPANYDAQGYPALDYLINGLASTDEDILARYTSHIDAEKTKAYLKKLISTHQTLLNQVINAWNSNREAFINNSGTSIGSSFSGVINGYIKNYEAFIRGGKIGIPSGAMMNWTPAIQTVEGLYIKNLSKTLAITAHQASIDFYEGKSVLNGSYGPSLKSYLNSLGTVDPTSQQKLGDIISEQFRVTTDKFVLLNDNFHAQLQADVQPFKDVYQEMQLSVKYLKADMTSAMSISITYADNDGD